jgi:hypothetical protein
MADVVHFKGLKDFHAQPERVQQNYYAALETLRIARAEHMPIRAAAKEAGISYQTAMRYIRPATERNAFGQTISKRADRLMRPMEVLTDRGPVEKAIRGSNKASTVGGYDSALGRFLEGDPRALEPFTGGHAAGVAFPTDPDTVEGLARSGVLDEYEPYPRARRR